MGNVDPLIVVSNDTHVGPRLVEDLREYCPAEYLNEFDRFAETSAEFRGAALGLADFFSSHPNFRTAGHHDSSSRLADYDYDGVAAGVIFHGSQNFEPLPFVPTLSDPSTLDRELMGVGQGIYNRWLADFVSEAPNRHIGVAYLPMWDVDSAIAEVESAHDAGLSAVNLPALRGGDVLEYNNREWDRLWATCEERRLPIITHVGAAGSIKYEGPEAIAIRAVESGSFYSRRAIWWLVFGGVFERFPGLRYVITETPGDWFGPLGKELDATWNMFSTKRGMKAAYETCPRRPSEYMASNVFFGASFASPYEVEQAVDNGLHTQLLWGSDYPHIEGTFVNPDGADMPSVTRLALRNSFCNVELEKSRQMVGDNAIAVYDLDRAALRDVANSIGALTLDELGTPIDAVPDGASDHAFRSGSTAWS